MATKKTKAGTEPRVTTFRGRSGRGAKSASFSFGAKAVSLAATAPVPEMPQVPRPSPTRYPIDAEMFAALKAKAVDAKPMAKRAVEVVTDAKSKRVELASMTALASPAATAPTPTLTAVASFAGAAQSGSTPWDATIAVGPQHVIGAINTAITIYTKAGAVLQQRMLAAWFDNVLEDVKLFDPQLAYDQFEGRWILVAMALAANPNRSFLLLSVSESADPLGRWRNFAFDASKDGTTATDNWADYPGLGLDAHNLYITMNMFRFGGSFQYAKLRVIPKRGPYTSTTVSFTDFARLRNDDGTGAFTVQPALTFGAPGVQYFVNTMFATTAQPTHRTLTLWTLREPAGTPRLSRKTLAITPYSLPPDAEQKDGGSPIDTGDNRVLKAVYSGGSLWCTFTTRYNWGASGNAAALHWVQIRVSEQRVLQQGIFGLAGAHYYYPSLMPDVNGNFVVVFCRSHKNEFPSIYFTGRHATDPAGQLRPSTLVKLGTANYTVIGSAGRNRWGDYCGSALDPTDSRTVWVHAGHALTPVSWATWIGAARF